ncbi:MAG: MBL fold metallo-hydrolase, partial [Burkholderiales bacterium]|nr:MBL fold metallo-hydrolase [Burkholderiales bacterium]
MSLLAVVLSVASHAQTPGASLIPADGGASAAKHFDPLGQPPSKFTLQLRNGQKAQLPFADKRDFDEAKRGFIAEPPYTKIMAD